MKKRFTEEQIINILKEQEAGFQVEKQDLTVKGTDGPFSPIYPSL